MTPQTPRGRFCNNGSVSTFFPPTGSHSKNDKSVTTLNKSGNILTTTLTDFLLKSQNKGISGQKQSFLRKISNSVHDVVHVPRVFDYTPEETMYCIEVKDLLKKYQEKPPVKIVKMPAISTNILEIISFDNKNLYFKNMIFKVVFYLNFYNHMPESQKNLE
ncbi:Protein CBG18344 [Caenorhabditis briggsae]|uniref:Protein CBG18344 n=1 Tax=Caenorhabditis briggsae TaxID=6238 RepID=A8XSH5_CAEBR|nr:Protein CBG18344 [Caenorhabditis briggsae]CAP35817.1 Protein CBG18344 [Caenorhabditis briggsae]